MCLPIQLALSGNNATSRFLPSLLLVAFLPVCNGYCIYHFVSTQFSQQSLKWSHVETMFRRRTLVEACGSFWYNSQSIITNKPRKISCESVIHSYRPDRECHKHRWTDVSKIGKMLYTIRHSLTCDLYTSHSRRPLGSDFGNGVLGY